MQRQNYDVKTTQIPRHAIAEATVAHIQRCVCGTTENARDVAPGELGDAELEARRGDEPHPPAVGPDRQDHVDVPSSATTTTAARTHTVTRASRQQIGCTEATTTGTGPTNPGVDTDARRNYTGSVEEQARHVELSSAVVRADVAYSSVYDAWWSMTVRILSDSMRKPWSSRNSSCIMG